MWEYVLLSIIAAIIFGLANFLQKKGLNQLPIITVSGFVKNIFYVLIRLLKNIYWIAGMLFGVLAWFIYMQALTFGDLIVIKPIINMNLVVIVILGVLFLKEKLTKTEIPLLSIIILGVIFLSYDPRTTGSVIFDELFLISTVIILIFTMLILNIINFKTAKKQYLLPINGGIAYGIAEVFTKWLSTQGILSISFPFNIIYFLMSPIFWGLAFFTIIGFIIKQSALSQCRACMAIPIINALSIIIPIIVSILIFGEELILLFTGYFLFPQSLFRIIGISIIIIGVILLNYILRKESCKIEMNHSL